MGDADRIRRAIPFDPPDQAPAPLQMGDTYWEDIISDALQRQDDALAQPFDGLTMDGLQDDLEPTNHIEDKKGNTDD